MTQIEKFEVLFICIINFLQLIFSYLAFYYIDKYEFPSFLFSKKYNKSKKVKTLQFPLFIILISSRKKNFLLQ